MIVDSEKHPERNVYFIGSCQLELLLASRRNEHDPLLLFQQYNKKNKTRISLDYHLLALDWLYLLGLIEINDKGNIVLCT